MVTLHLPEDKEMTVLGRNITRLRKQKEWTQTRLAKEAGIAAAYLNQIEHGVRNGRPETQFAIGSALGVTLQELTQPHDADMAAAEAEAASEFEEAMDDLKAVTEKAARMSDDPASVFTIVAKRVRDVAGGVTK
jgi:transcriptional regulator with XRE-family HTH domain